MKLYQSNAIQALLERYGVERANPVHTPMLSNSPLVPDDQLQNQLKDDEITWYQQLVGVLLWVMLATRPDISFAVSRLSKFSHQPSIIHAQALKRLLRYLVATKHLGLLYYDAPFSLDGYSDSDFAADSATRKSVKAYIFKLGHDSIS